MGDIASAVNFIEPDSEKYQGYVDLLKSNKLWRERGR